MFRLRHGRFLVPGIPQPAAAGGEADSITFHGGGRSTDAIPPPAPSTPQQRAEGRAFERLLDDTWRSMSARSRAVERSMQQYDRERKPCQDELERFESDTPQDAVMGALVGLLYDEAATRAYLDVIRGAADRLETLDLQDPVLRAGADAWIRAVRRNDRPYPRPDLCTVIARWAQTGYDMARAPVDPATAEQQELVVEVESSREIEAAADRLRELGARRRTQQHLEGSWFNTGAYLF